MSLKRAAHSVWDCQYHLVWTPKRRRPVFVGDVAQRLDALLREIAEARDIEIVTLHVAEDHVHLLCSFAPRLSISQVVALLKSLSARALFAEFPHLRKRMWGNELWEGSYFVRTVGSNVDAAMVKFYIERHANEKVEEAPESQ